MSPPLNCGCTLCILEPRLLAAISSTDAEVIRDLIPGSCFRYEISCAAELLSHLKTLTADSASDEFLRALLMARPLDPTFIESVLILAFLPTLHATVRRVGKQQPGLLQEDIVQQALSVLLQYLRSGELHSRQSHFAFAISRAVKRKVFEWAQRESRAYELPPLGTSVVDALTEDYSFERHVLLRHFLYRCVTKRFITNSELNLLIDYKLDDGFFDPRYGSNGNSSNAIRQKLKRLLRKLRRIANER